MRLRNKRQALGSFCKVRFLNHKIPLAVRWQLTNRCVCQCQYCNIWKTPESELSLAQIKAILDEMAALGTQTISFSGGEPMLRQDIGRILDETVRRGISTEMNSTGAGIAERMSELKSLHYLKISLDGPEEIHNAVRGPHAFKIAMKAAEAAAKAGLKFSFATTLTKFNIQEIDFILDIAKRFNTMAAFQPLKKLYRGVKDVSGLEPDPEEYRRVIDQLIAYKKAGDPHLRNSQIGLHHIYHAPQYPRLKCWAGRVFCILNTDGTLMPCDRIAYSSPLPNCAASGFRNAFLALPEVHCAGCGFCGVLELNFLMAFKLGTLDSVYKVLK
ncbi:MAG: radical SAM protein [Candidatus Omnitrophica bacterium]|nr:radical SAM protein [Candidatus Omnitrophota bacterium]